MLLAKEEIERCQSWLLANASPPVLYLAYKNLVGGFAEKAEKSLWAEVESYKDSRELLDAQEKDGSWFSGGSWALKPSYSQKSKENGYDPESPKYVTTIWVLPLLGDMGFTAADTRVRAGCEYIVNYRGIEGLYPLFHDSDLLEGSGKERSYCRFSQYLIALSRVGYAADPRTQRGYKALVKAQREDGGWVSPNCLAERAWTRSCPCSTYQAAYALYSSQDPRYKTNLDRALEFLIWHLSSKQEDEIKKFYFHGHSILHELLMFSETGIGLDSKPVAAILQWLREMYLSDEGFFRYKGKSISKYSRKNDGMDSRVAKYRLYHLIDDDWLSYYLTLIAKNILAKETP